MSAPLTPTSEAELAQIIGSATVPLSIRGGATRGVDSTGTLLSTSELRGITLYEPGALTLVAQAGTPLEDIEATLAAEGQRLAFEPLNLRALLGTTGTPTLGGAIAANASGPRRIAVGAARDFLLGVRFVDGMGRVISNGGRVMKNVTGYDLVKLLAGSWGTLGVLSEVSLKVLPRPETSATLVLHGLDVARAVEALSAGLGSPFEVTGAAHLPDTDETLLRIEGQASSVAYRAGRLAEALTPYGTAERRDGFDWTPIRDVTGWAQGRPRGADDVWRVSVKPSDAPALAARMPEGAALRLDWGGGLIWVAVPPGTDLRAHLVPFAGHATRVRGDAADGISRLHPEPAAIAALSAGIKARFDPRGLLNPGAMGPAQGTR
ncbi:2-hydroxy-acid oxidase [Roseovarius sp. 22II1-1F6A]|nr:2-hydroxy-acid oxidase [Roseovarius sp. 22II1-1F6A]